MTTEAIDATQEAGRAGGSAPANRLLERLAELIGAKAGVQAVFGEPIREDNLTVIPVARVRWGFGGGGGRADGPETGPASGSGGGGGVAADPIGYVEIVSTGATFRPIRDPYPSPVFLLASGLTAALDSLVHEEVLMGRRIRKITVVGVRTPPPWPLRPLVDEVLRALDAKRRAQALSEDGAETGAPGGERRTAGQGERSGR